jgi:Tol biopolymer transport system component
MEGTSIRFTYTPDPSTPFTHRPFLRDLAISPDGEFVVYNGVGAEGRTQLYMRVLGELEATPIRGADPAWGPVVSPDGAWVAFTSSEAENRLQRVAVLGGAPLTLAEVPTPIRGVS